MKFHPAVYKGMAEATKRHNAKTEAPKRKKLSRQEQLVKRDEIIAWASQFSQWANGQVREYKSFTHQGKEAKMYAKVVNNGVVHFFFFLEVDGTLINRFYTQGLRIGHYDLEAGGWVYGSNDETYLQWASQSSAEMQKRELF